MPEFRQEVRFDAAPERVFSALADSALHSAFTGGPATIATEEGGAWSAFGGAISGRQVEIVPGRLLVQTWRAGNWPEGTHSLVKFELHADGAGTRLVLDHLATPPGDHGAHLEQGWHDRYWGPLRSWLAAG